MGFGGEIGQVGSAGSPFEDEMAQFDAVLDPVVPHVDGLATFYLGGTMSNIACWLVIVGNDCWKLGVTQVGEGLAIDSGVLSIVKQGSVGGFGCGANYGRDDGGRCADRTVD